MILAISVVVAGQRLRIDNLTSVGGTLCLRVIVPCPVVQPEPPFSCTGRIACDMLLNALSLCLKRRPWLGERKFEVLSDGYMTAYGYCIYERNLPSCGAGGRLGLAGEGGVMVVSANRKEEGGSISVNGFL